MDILQLQCFLKVAHCLSFSEAANQLFISQSAVSKQIKALEYELNLQLFDRSHRQISLTVSGRALLEHAQKITTDYDEMMAALSELEEFQHQTLCIASIPIIAQYGIASVFARFQEAVPSIRIRVEEMEAETIPSALQNGNCCLAIIRQEIINSAEFETLPLYSDQMVAVFSLNHPLATEIEISLDQLSHENIILLNKGTLLYDYLLSTLIHEGLKPNIIYNGARTETVIEMIAHNMGVSLMMNRMVAYYQSNEVTVVPIREKIVSTVALARRRRTNISKPAQIFWEFVRKHDFT